jgi:hypothetical protein
MFPCTPAVNHPAGSVIPRPPLVCTPLLAGARVDGNGPPLPFNLKALSQGRPDGLYVAGKQLRAWLSLDERVTLGQLQGERDDRRISSAGLFALSALETAARGASVVVRWRIEGGFAGAPEVMLSKRCLSRTWVVEDAYTWRSGAEREHVHVCLLDHDLARWALEEMGIRGGSTNTYYRMAQSLTSALGAEWVLPIADVCRLIAGEQLRQARATMVGAVEQAQRWGAI